MSAATTQSRFLAAIDSLFGYDLFVSYGRRDGGSYAAALAKELAGRNLSVFFDREELPAGESLRTGLRRALGKTSTLVVVATAGAIQSTHVANEVDQFARRRKRPIVVIRPPAEESLPWPAVRQRDLIWLDEPSASVYGGKPSPNTIVEIERSLRTTRKRTLASRVLLGTSALIFLLALASLVGLFNVRRLTSEAQQTLANLQAAARRARIQEQLAEKRGREVTVESLARHAATANEPPELNLRVALEAVERGRNLPVFQVAERSLRQAIVHMGGVFFFPGQTPEREVSVSGRAVSNNGRWMAIVADGMLYLYDLRAPARPFQRFRVASALVGGLGPAVSVSNEGDITLAASTSAARWRAGASVPRTGSCRCETYQSDISDDGRWLLNREDELVDLTRMSADAVKLPGARFASNRQWLIVPGDKVQVWKTADLRRRLRERPHSSPSSPPSVPADDRLVLDGENGYLPRFRDVSPDGRWLIEWWGTHKTLWDLRGDNAPRVLAQGVDNTILRVGVYAEPPRPEFSPDGRYLVIIGVGNVPLVYDLRAHRKPLRLKTDSMRMNSEGRVGTLPVFSAVAFSPDGRWMATAGDDVSLWALSAPAFSKPYLVLHGADAVIQRLVFSPNGRWLLSEAKESETRLWDLQHSDPDLEPLDLGKVDGCHFSDDSRWVVSTDYTGYPLASHYASVYRYWPLDLKDMIETASRFAVPGFTEEQWKRLLPGQPYRGVSTAAAVR